MILSLHPLTVLDASPRELIDFAHRLGVASVCLFTHVPEAGAGRYPLVARDDVAGLHSLLWEVGITLSNLEVFPLDRTGPRDDLDAGLAIGAALGATRATAHLHDLSSEQEGVDRFAEFAGRAATHGIVAGLEFNNFSAVAISQAPNGSSARPVGDRWCSTCFTRCAAARRHAMSRGPRT